MLDSTLTTLAEMLVEGSVLVLGASSEARRTSSLGGLEEDL